MSEKEAEFLNKLGALLRECSREPVESITRQERGGKKYACIKLENGEIIHVNITGDSCAAMLCDVGRTLICR